MARERRPPVARWAVAGLLLGLAAGLVVAFPRGGDALLKPVMVPLAVAAAGGLLGVVAGLAQRALRRTRAPAAETVAAEPEAPPAVPSGLPAPPPAEDGRPAPEGWYPDPLDPAAQRWWDGDGWTAHVWRPRRRAPR